MHVSIYVCIAAEARCGGSEPGAQEDSHSGALSAFDRDDYTRSESHPRPPGLPTEDELSDEDLIGPGARASDDLGTSTGATGVE